MTDGIGPSLAARQHWTLHRSSDFPAPEHVKVYRDTWKYGLEAEVLDGDFGVITIR